MAHNASLSQDSAPTAVSSVLATQYPELSHLRIQLREQAAQETPIEALDALFQPLPHLLTAPTESLIGASLPLMGQQRQLVNLLQDLLDLLACAYEKQLAQLTLHSSLEKGTALLEKISFCLAQHLYISYLTNAPAGRNIWKRLHHALLLSPWNISSEPGCRLIYQHYAWILLLACARPNTFSSRELSFVEHYIRQQDNLPKLDPHPPENREGAFWIDPERDLPALPLTSTTPISSSPIFYFSCTTLARQAGTHLQALQQGTGTHALALPPFAASPAGKSGLRRLAKSWGSISQRRFPRRRQQSVRTILCLGLLRIWYLIQHQEQLLDEALSQWMITNESPGGYVLMHLKGRLKQLQAGEVAAIYQEDGEGFTGKWTLAIVRWVLSENPEHIEIGLQLLATELHSTVLHLQSENSPSIPVLWLPQSSRLRENPWLILPSDTVTPRQNALLRSLDSDNIPIKFMDLQEQSSRIEIFSFKTLI